MKRIKVLAIFLVLIFSQGYANKKYMVEKDFVDRISSNQFKALNIKHQKAKEVIDQYFGKIPYKVIWAKPYGYGNKMVYFAVEEYMPEKYYNAIKRGIVVKEDGVIDVYFDTEKGLYNEQDQIIDFKKIGFKKNEVKCIILNKDKNEKKNTTYWINLLDQDDYNIQHSNWQNSASISIMAIEFSEQISKREKFVVHQDWPDSATEEEVLRMYQDKLNAYRQAKTQGKAVKSAAVKTEFEKYRKAGLVEK